MLYTTIQREVFYFEFFYRILFTALVTLQIKMIKDDLIKYCSVL